MEKLNTEFVANPSGPRYQVHGTTIYDVDTGHKIVCATVSDANDRAKQLNAED